MLVLNVHFVCPPPPPHTHTLRHLGKQFACLTLFPLLVPVLFTSIKLAPVVRTPVSAALE